MRACSSLTPGTSYVVGHLRQVEHELSLGGVGNQAPPS